MPFTDCHLHLPVTALARWREAGLSQAVLAAVTAEDWPAVLSAADEHPETLLPALGVHPWYVPQVVSLGELPALLKAHPHCAVGEIGLDGCPGKPPMEWQAAWFRRQLEVAAQLARPAVVHIVRAWDDAWEILKDFPEIPVVVHGFHGSAEIVRRFLPLPKLRFSVGFDALEPGRHFAAALRAIPHERLLVDSDAPCRGHSPDELPALIRALAERLALAPGILEARLMENFHALFFCGC